MEAYKLLDIDKLENDIKKNKLENCYILLGTDEELIKEQVQLIIDKAIDPSFMDLNLIKFDGMKFTGETFRDSCETLPFLSDKKVILVYRANFLKDINDNDSKKAFEACKEYIENTPSHCILIFYYILDDKREKISNRAKKLEKHSLIIKADRLKGERLYKRVEERFKAQGKDIGKIELKYFCEKVENNTHMIYSEIDKLINYTDGRKISKADIDAMLPYKSENDIFDLVDYIADKKSEKAIELMNELLFKGENIMYILTMIERQFKLLFRVKLNKQQTTDSIVKELRLPPFICDRLIRQSRKFKLKQLKGCIELCLSTEKTLKSTTLDKKTELELMIINTVII